MGGASLSWSPPKALGLQPPGLTPASPLGLPLLVLSAPAAKVPAGHDFVSLTHWDDFPAFPGPEPLVKCHGGKALGPQTDPDGDECPGGPVDR